ncbi:hypothetical protein V8C86DRAFT_2493539 [Haematococcus lacustris]
MRICALLAIAIAVCIAAVRPSEALYTSKDYVVPLTASNFNKLVDGSIGVAAVEFYAPWCGHCKSLAPHWAKVASSLKGMATIGAVDCDDKANQKLCARFGVTSFPTIKLFGPDQQKNPYTGEMTKEAIDYKGPRTAKMITSTVTELLTDLHVARIAGNSRAQLQAFLDSQPGLAKVVLLSEKPEVGTLYRALSTLLRHQLAFAQVDVSAGSGVAQALGAPESLPAVMLLKPGEEAGEAYSGELKAEPLLTALKQFSALHSAAAPSSKDEGEAAAPDAPPSGSDRAQAQPPVAAEGVKELDWEAVMALDAKEDIALLVLQAGDQASCTAALDAIYSVLADVKDMVTCGRVVVGPQDADKLRQFGSSVSTMLTDPEALTSSCTQRLLLLPYGPDKADLDEYQVYSGAMEAKALTAWVVDAMPDRTQQVMGAGFQTFLTLAGLPQAGGQEAEGGRGPSVPGSWASIAQAIGSPLPPKVLLVTNKGEVPAVFKALALAFSSRAPWLPFGWVKADSEDAEPIITNLQPPKVPCVLLLSVVSPDKDSQGFRIRAQPYQGAIKFVKLAAWLGAFVDGMLEMAGQTRGGSARAQVAVPELRGDRDLAEQCVDKGAGICIIGLLDGRQPGQHASAVLLLNTVAGQRAGEPLHFSHLDAAKYSAFASALGVMGSDLPTLVALSARRMRYAVMREGLPQAGGERAVSDFIDGVLRGVTKTLALEALPLVQEGSSAQDVRSDGTPAASTDDTGCEADLAVVDEFDLSDIMGEEVEGQEALLSTQDKLRKVEEELQAAAAHAAPEKKKKKSKGKKKVKKANTEL